MPTLARPTAALAGLTLLFSPACSTVPDEPAARGTTLCAVAFAGDAARSFLPDELQLEILFDGLTIGEGPVWVPAKAQLVVSDVAANKMYTWSESSGHEVLLEASGQTGAAPFFAGGVLGSNGAAVDAAGDIVFCQHGNRQLAKMSMDAANAQSITSLVADVGGKRFNSPNDLTIAPSGEVYFSDPPYGFLDIANSDPTAGKMIFVAEGRELDRSGIYRFDPGTGELDLLSDVMELPNGMALSPDSAWLYVNSSNMQKREIWRFSTADGSGSVFYDGPFGDDENGWFDGMKMHSSGNIFTSGPGGLLVISPAGERIATVELPDPITNCCFDEDEGHVYVTSLNYVGRLRLKP